MDGQTKAEHISLHDLIDRIEPDHAQHENVIVIVVRSSIHNGLTVVIPATSGVQQIDPNDIR